MQRLKFISFSNLSPINHPDRREAVFLCLEQK
nr:MAG TPA_asm: hypothetical protein [Caudoviricetes sp.]